MARVGSRYVGCVSVLCAATFYTPVDAASTFTLKVSKFTRRGVTATLATPLSTFDAEAGDQIEAEFYLSGWGPDLAPSGLLHLYQAGVWMSRSAQSGDRGFVLPLGWDAPLDPPLITPCDSDEECLLACTSCEEGQCIGGIRCFIDAQCQVEDPNAPDAECRSRFPICQSVSSPHVCIGADHDPNLGAFIEVTNPDYVFSGLGVIQAVSLGSASYRYGGLEFDFVGVVDTGVPMYAGTLLLVVSEDACGEFVFDFAGESTFIASLPEPGGAAFVFPDGEPLGIRVVSPCIPQLVSSAPPNCAVDARIPHDRLDHTVRFGWGSKEEPIELRFDLRHVEMTAADFAVSVTGAGVPPTIDSIVSADDSVTLVLNRPIPARRHTCIRHLASNQQVCLGHMPGDTNADGVTDSSDLLALADELSAALNPAMEEWQCDIDRSGICAPLDLIVEVDLQNGESLFDVFSSPSFLKACPSESP